MGPENGTPVVLVHGTGSWSEIWRETMNALALGGYRAIAIDIPPFGFSGKPDGSSAYSSIKQGSRINAFLDSLNINDCILVGHSVGGRPTLEAILNRKERVKKIVLVDVALGFANDSLNPHFAQNDPDYLTRKFFQIKALRNPILRATASNPYFTKKLLESFVYNKNAIKDSHVAMLQQPLKLKNSSRANADWLEQLLTTEDDQAVSTKFGNYQSIEAPVLLIWGDKDDITPLWQGNALKQLFPNSELKVIKETGHIPYIENPPLFNQILLDFLDN